MATFRISELAEQAGVPATTLRFYEQIGLLTAARSANGYRRYTPDALDRLALIRAGQHLGLPLAEIRTLLDVRDAGECATVRARLRPALAARITEARARAASTAESIARLEQALVATDPAPPNGPCAPTCGCLTTSASHSTLAPRQPHQSLASQQTHRPIACSLDGDDQQARLTAWRDLLAQATARQPVTDGARFTLPAARAGRAAELAAAEQRCCPFFRFTLVFDGGDVHLTVQAPADAAGLLAALTDEPAAPLSS
jgi:MerR family copper efflux transcriptional regulator